MTVRFFLLLTFIAPFLVTSAYADTSQSGFMTSRDILSNDIPSNINLHNNRNSAATVFGVYVRKISYVTPGDTCDHSTVMFPTIASPAIVAAGSAVTPVTISGGKSAPIGSNYLYNMIYGAAYYISIIDPSSPPGCALPGCTWGSDTTRYNWCIFLGALAPVANTASYAANVPPSTNTTSSTGNYNYDLVNTYVMLGPISCNDQTLTCTVANQQTQSFS